MGSATAFDNRADAEETVRHGRAIAHNRVTTSRAPMAARGRGGAATAQVGIAGSTDADRSDDAVNVAVRRSRQQLLRRCARRDRGLLG
jgi:hypothetical protein